MPIKRGTPARTHSPMVGNMRYAALALLLAACTAAPAAPSTTTTSSTTTTTVQRGVDEVDAWLACESVIRREVAGAEFPWNYGSEDEWMVQNGDGWIVLAWVESAHLSRTDFRCVVTGDGVVEGVTLG
jgi:hypothetical protein